MYGEAEDEQDEDDEVDAPGEGQHSLGWDSNVAHLSKEGMECGVWGSGMGYGVWGIERRRVRKEQERGGVRSRYIKVAVCRNWTGEMAD